MPYVCNMVYDIALANMQLFILKIAGEAKMVIYAWLKLRKWKFATGVRGYIREQALKLWSSVQPKGKAFEPVLHICVVF